MGVIVKDCSTPAHVRAAVETRRGLTGRCWTILEGGNRGDVLRSSAAVMGYGDLNGGNEVGRIDHGDESDGHIAGA